MTDDEIKLMDMMGQVWNEFCKLSQTHEHGGHQDDLIDFKFHLHALENIVGARPGFRLYRNLPDRIQQDKKVDLTP